MQNASNTRLKQSVIDSTILSERIKEDYENKRVLNFDSVINEHHELINIKKRVLNGYFFKIERLGLIPRVAAG